jgi:hydroxymethylpyrimidine/phosphomethylpyrimidine kinase
VPRATVLTIAGSDPSGGAGLLADAATICAFGCHAQGVVTALTVQDSRGVHAVLPVDAAHVGAQLRALLADGPPAAAKTGMLPTAAVVEAVAAAWRAQAAVPLVVDPVIAASSGPRLADAGAVAALLGALLPLAALVTPNAPEARELTGLTVRDTEGAVAAARALVARGARAVLVKGGHLEGDEVTDVLVVAGRPDAVAFTRRRVAHVRRVRGTGCALSAAIAARLALGDALDAAVAAAGDWVHAAIAGATVSGAGGLVLARPAADAGRSA